MKKLQIKTTEKLYADKKTNSFTITIRNFSTETNKEIVALPAIIYADHIEIQSLENYRKLTIKQMEILAQSLLLIAKEAKKVQFDFVPTQQDE